MWQHSNWREIGREQWLCMISACFIVFFISFGATRAVTESGIKSSDVASWMQAIGAIAAIIGAIWISREAERKRQINAMTVAKVVAATMLHRMIVMKGDLRKTHEWFETTKITDGDYRAFQHHCDTLKLQPSWDAKTLAQLTPIPGSCALKIAAGFDVLFSAIAILEKAIVDRRLPIDDEYRKYHADLLSIMLNEVRGNFRQAITEIQMQVYGVSDIDLHDHASITSSYVESPYDHQCG